jgi:phosphatidylserine decarboxylase
MTTPFILLQKIVPHHLLSRLTGKFAASEVGWLKNLLIQRFIAAYGVNMQEAAEPDPTKYPSFNAFFTRALKHGARGLASASNAVLSPADGAISALGPIHDDAIFQAKGHDYSLTTLLGGDTERAAPFRNGSFATVYLSPRDYHRVHIPLGGTLREMIYVPGELFSVNQVTAENIPGLFARNERAVCIFDTAVGPMAVVLVGAMIVAGIETVWAGHVAPSTHGLRVTDYRNAQPPIHLHRGDELGRFLLGSTAIVLFGPNVATWREDLMAGSPVRMGEQMGTLVQR